MARAERGVVGVSQQHVLLAQRKSSGCGGVSSGLDEDLRGAASRAYVVEVSRLLDVAGVVEARATLEGSGAARIGARGLVGGVGRDGKAAASTLPVDEVVAPEVSPPTRRPLPGPVGTVLMEHVVGIAQLAEAVGVVEPAGGRHEVKAHSPGIV